ncbi:hypothetical protein KBW71_07450 [Hydrogenophaga aromaticivorans]|uniref:hypothetical protein n=1 Tax=Hydrogenophaga aromaticivorans TaxID=2610898 RepID=UPI001B37A4F2|nr:hypothetical protein [Hydrogenophaga aromaticivorans]MBQ0918276.1 hypothetical protein [Hydrogenophaga aromaticivorans]
MIKPKSLGALCEAVRLSKANPHMEFGVKGDVSVMTSHDVLAMWRSGVDARASRGLHQLTLAQEKRYSDTQWDAQKVNEYASGVRSSGCRNLLRSPRMKRRYPHVDNQERAW